MASIYEDVRMRLYFKGEALKRKDADYCVVQASTDEDLDMMKGFAESAMNEVAQTVVKRMASFDWGIYVMQKVTNAPSDEATAGESTAYESAAESGTESTSDESTSGRNEQCLYIVFVPYVRKKPEDEERMRKIAEKAIFDYVVNFCIGEWLGVVSPELAQEFVARNDGLMFKVQRAFAGLSPMLRRRATDLAGI